MDDTPAVHAKKIIKYWIITDTPLNPLILMKKLEGKIWTYPRLLHTILSFSRVVSVGALCNFFEKTETAPGPRVTFLSFSRGIIVNALFIDGKKESTCTHEAPEKIASPQ